ncbi:MAG: hypothetical protein AAGF12_27350 [Myxococcota bacterium]
MPKRLSAATWEWFRWSVEATLPTVTVVLAVAAGCVSDAPTVHSCPVVPGKTGEWSGVYGTAGTLEPYSCFRVMVGADVVGQGRASGSGSFAHRFRAEDISNSPIRVIHSRGEFPVAAAGNPQATISYEAGAIPIELRPDGTAAVTTWFEPRGDSTHAIEGAFVINWESGQTLPVRPTPLLGQLFAASIDAVPGDRVATASRHTKGVGGCFWPQGGGGVCRGAPKECPEPRGCVRIAAREPSRTSGPPEIRESIPVGFATEPAYSPPPPDGGTSSMPDASTQEAGLW